ncbi:MAG: quinolinate synthase NadA [Nitrososphaeraceae archaeon]
MSVVTDDYKLKITELKKKLGATILAHNYQLPEVQDIADYVGDSLGLSTNAARTEQETIVFCGVHFMAETASIICPDKEVLIPDLEAGCSLASTIDSAQLKAWKSEHADAVVVSYVNTSAEIKAMSDYCCTSSNAVKVVNSIPKDREVLFLPDMFLGAYVADMTRRKNMFIWPGECHVHAGIRAEDVNKMLSKFKDADFLIHPECGCTSSTLYNSSNGDILKRPYILSTEGMMNHARTSNASKYLVATEVGILHRMTKQNPSKTFIPIKENAICKYMKMITVQKVYDSLTKNIYRVKVPQKIADRARLAIDRMLQLN